jgi:hypothetical protein
MLRRRCRSGARAGPTLPAVRTLPWRGPCVGYRGWAHGHAHSRPPARDAAGRAALFGCHRWPRAAPPAPRPGSACVHAHQYARPTPHALILPCIRPGAAPSRPAAPAVAAGRSSPVRPTVLRPSSSSSATLASTLTPWTPCALALAGRPTCLPALRPRQPTAALLAADRRRSRFRPSRPHQSTEGESKPHPSRSLGRVRPFLAAGRPCFADGDLLARIAIFRDA